MFAKHQPEVVTAFYKLQKLDQQLRTMHRNGAFNNIPLHKRTSFFKRYKRYLKKIFSAEEPVSKAIAAFAVAMLLYTGSDAQSSCKTYKDAFESNPLKREPLPNDLSKPVFVDIDGDGDLDCYAIYRFKSGNGSTYDSVRFSFLKNVGTSTFPVFEADGTGGFPAAPDAVFWLPADLDYVQSQEGPVFADLDGDGDYDCFLANYTYPGWPRLTVEYFENTGDNHHPVFVQRPKNQNPLSFVAGYRALLFNLADIDGDGDYDLLTFAGYYVRAYENKGTKNNPDFVFIKDNNGSFFGNPYFDHYVFIDWNKDGRLDAIPLGGGVFYTYVGAGEDHYAVTKNHMDAPKFTGTVGAYAMADLNNDGFPEAIGFNLDYATTSPNAVIQATNNNTITRLDAYPKGAYTYQWTKDRQNILNATGDFIEVSQTGDYNVEITGNCGTGLSLPYSVTNNAAVIASAQVKKNINPGIYPSPFTDECILKFDKPIPGKTIVHVTDAGGRLVISLNADYNTTRFGRELKPGIYFVQVIQNNNVIYRQKIIKQ